MSLIPKTVCRRCHREFPSLRSRCPYCGTRKPQEVKRSLPESDSAVRGTRAARQASENINWQMVIGGVLLLLVIVAVVAIVSVNMSSRVAETEAILLEEESIPEVAAETTAVPIPTATPTPTPVPTPQITSISVTWLGQPLPNGVIDFSGAQYDLDATPYPLMEDVVVEWYSTDESCATVDENGVVTIVGGYGTQCDIVAKVGTFEQKTHFWGK